MTDDLTITGPPAYAPGMSWLERAQAAQARVRDAEETLRVARAERDQAVCAAWRSGEAGRVVLHRALGVSLSTIDHTLDPRRSGGC